MPSRTRAGLPEHGFVFASFNNSYKFSPLSFDIWMRLLRAVDGSVLWLSQPNPAATRNLRREAEARGVDPARLIFALRLPAPEDHLARLGLADLFLDTLPYNAHTTAMDALWAGLPVLTSMGDSFASRVAASQLHAAGLPELVADSLEAYEEKALILARDPGAIATLKAKLASNRGHCALFDTERFTRNLERAYHTMWLRAERGAPAETFHIEETSHP
jgi:predicted O-linked N-acetylglucosamine transferase (SPINDLY family)